VRVTGRNSSSRLFLVSSRDNRIVLVSEEYKQYYYH
jgi:hypothetical protein